MYLEHFKLNQLPFQLTPDPDFLFLSNAHARAKAHMEYAVWNRDGFCVITGESGCGKTTLLTKLLSSLDENVLVAKIFQTQLDETEFLQAVLVEFGLNPFQAKKVELLDMLNQFLIENFHAQRQTVLVVDDAQNLSPKVLEEIRMLSSLETNKEKLLHIILVGHSELKEVLDDPSMEQLQQRIRLRYHLRPLSEKETHDYILHRLAVAGADATAAPLFSDDCFAKIFEYTGGTPRLINTLCDVALTCAFVDEAAQVNLNSIVDAIDELQWYPFTERKPKRRQDDVRSRSLTSALRDHDRKLDALIAGLNQLGEITPLLNSMRTVLMTMEVHLRRLENDGTKIATFGQSMAGIEQQLKRLADSAQATTLPTIPDPKLRVVEPNTQRGRGLGLSGNLNEPW